MIIIINLPFGLLLNIYPVLECILLKNVDSGMHIDALTSGSGPLTVRMVKYVRQFQTKLKYRYCTNVKDS